MNWNKLGIIKGPKLELCSKDDYGLKDITTRPMHIQKLKPNEQLLFLQYKFHIQNHDKLNELQSTDGKTLKANSSLLHENIS